MNVRGTVVTIISITIALIAGSSVADAATSSTYLGALSSGDGQNALAGYLDMPRGVAVGNDKTIYIADTINNLIRTIAPDGTLGTFSGNGDYGTVNGRRQRATWSEPEGIVIDRSGTVYVADTASNQIRRIRNGSVSSILKTGLKRPSGIALSGNTLYIADTGNNRVVAARTNGKNLQVLATSITAPLKLVRLGSKLYVTSAEKGTVTAIDLATKKKRTLAKNLIEPRGIVAVNGSLIVSAGESGIWNELWRINPASGAKTRLDRRRETEWLNQTADIAVTTINGEQRLLLLQQGGSSLFSVGVAGQDLQQIAGKHRYQDEMGNRGVARLGRPKMLAAAPGGSRLYLSYANSNKLAVLDMASGVTAFLAGHLMDNYREGTGDGARFSDISGMAVSPDGAILYVTDRNNHRIRSVNTRTGETAYLTGAGIINLIDSTSGSEQIDTTYKNGYKEGGPCPNALTKGVRGCAYFDRPMGIALTKDGKTLYVADASNNRVRTVNTATGKTAFLAGSGKAGFKDGIGKNAVFHGPTAVALSANEKTLYVVDKSNHAIRVIDLKSKKVSTIAGNGNAGYRDGAFSKARFSVPEFITVDAKGNLLISESGGLRIRKLDLTRGITTLVSGSGKRGFKNGKAANARWNNPKGLVIVGSRLLVADSKNDMVRVLGL